MSKPLPQLSKRTSRFMSLPKLANAIERDRGERDKVLCYALDLDRIACELKDVLESFEKPDGSAFLTRYDALTLLRSIVREES